MIYNAAEDVETEMALSIINFKLATSSFICGINTWVLICGIVFNLQIFLKLGVQTNARSFPAYHSTMGLAQIISSFMQLLSQQGSVKEECDLRKMRDEELGYLEALPYHERLTKFARGSTRHLLKDSVTVLDFRPLYAITIHHLQRSLAKEIQQMVQMTASETQLERLRITLRRYSMSPQSPFLEK